MHFEFVSCFPTFWTEGVLRRKRLYIDLYGMQRLECFGQLPNAYVFPPPICFILNLNYIETCAELASTIFVTSCRPLLFAHSYRWFFFETSYYRTSKWHADLRIYVISTTLKIYPRIVLFGHYWQFLVYVRLVGVYVSIIKHWRVLWRFVSKNYFYT